MTQIKTFSVGDKVIRKIVGNTVVLTVTYVSKCGELIATECNGFFNPVDWSAGYKKAN